jgi:hypothetical protein
MNRAERLGLHGGERGVLLVMRVRQPCAGLGGCILGHQGCASGEANQEKSHSKLRSLIHLYHSYYLAMRLWARELGRYDSNSRVAVYPVRVVNGR